MFTIKPTKEESKLINWLRKAASKDEGRQVLMNLFVKNGQMVACDGYRIHTIPTPESIKTQDFAEAMIAPQAKTMPNVPNEFEIVTIGTYPDLDYVTPKGQPSFVIGVNPKYLIDALSAFEEGQPVILSFYTPHQPFSVSSKDEPQTALVMPMSIK